MRYGQRSILKKEKCKEYVDLHQDVWPEITEIMARSNIKNYTIFIDGNELFTYFEYTGDDYIKDVDLMNSDPVMKEWYKLSKPCFSKYPDNSFYKKMNEVFHYD